MTRIYDPSGAGFFRHPRIKGVLIAGAETSLWHALRIKQVPCEFHQVHATLVELCGPKSGELEFLTLYLYWWVSTCLGVIEDEDGIYTQFLALLAEKRRTEP